VPGRVEWCLSDHVTVQCLPNRAAVPNLLVNPYLPEVGTLSGWASALSGPLPAGLRLLRYPLPADLPAPLTGCFLRPVEAIGLTTFHMSTIPGGVRLRLSAGGAASARGELGAPLPDHLPFGPSLSASWAC
jgi:hypothetical protein